MRTIVHEPQPLDLSRRQITGDVDRHFFQSERLRGREAQMPDDDYAVNVDNDRLTDTIRTDAGRNLRDCVGAPFPGVLGIRLRSIDWPDFNFHEYLLKDFWIFRRLRFALTCRTGPCFYLTRGSLAYQTHSSQPHEFAL